MRNIEEIRYFIAKWKELTYKQGLDSCYAIKRNARVYEMTLRVLELQCLENKVMDGNSVTNIPFKNEGKTEVIFADIFWRLTESFISPASYIATIVKECVDNEILDINEIAGIVGRGLRAFASFLREIDLTYKFAKYFPESQLINNPTQDVQEHTDIFIKSKGDSYRIWSYQNFERGLINTAARIKGKRGSVPRGIHVLCPIDISNEYEREEVEGWYFYSDRYVNYLHEMIVIEKPDEYSFICRMNEYALKEYLKKANTVKKQ